MGDWDPSPDNSDRSRNVEELRLRIRDFTVSLRFSPTRSEEGRAIAGTASLPAVLPLHSSRSSPSFLSCLVPEYPLLGLLQTFARALEISASWS